MQAVCPQCGSAETQRRSGAQRVCRECGTRFTLPIPFGERLIFTLVFFVPGLVFGIVAVVMILMAMSKQGQQASGTFVGAGGACGTISLICLIQGIRELIGHTKAPSERRAGHLVGESLEVELPQVIPCPPLVPQEKAEALVREIGEKHGTKRILQSLGNLPQKHVDNAVAHFANPMDDDESPLALIDSSFLSDGKSGLLLTNRGLYSSYYSRPLWLADINDVSYATPGFDRNFFIYLLTAGMIVCAYLGGMLGAGIGLFLSQLGLPPRPFSPGWSLLSMFLSIYLAIYLFAGFGRLHNRLLVNGKTVYRGKRLRGAFWVELLTKLAEAARQTAAENDSKQKPNVVVLETALRDREDETIEMRPLRNPSRHDLERSIRALDQNIHPSLRIWAGEIEQAPALEVLGGNGKYVLRELGDGWTYYDPGAGEEEIEVCTGVPGHRAAAFYVCTDLQRVLEIARHFVETGTPE